MPVSAKIFYTAWLDEIGMDSSLVLVDGSLQLKDRVTQSFFSSTYSRWLEANVFNATFWEWLATGAAKTRFGFTDAQVMELRAARPIWWQPSAAMTRPHTPTPQRRR